MQRTGEARGGVFKQDINPCLKVWKCGEGVRAGAPQLVSTPPKTLNKHSLPPCILPTFSSHLCLPIHTPFHCITLPHLPEHPDNVTLLNAFTCTPPTFSSYLALPPLVHTLSPFSRSPHTIILLPYLPPPPNHPDNVTLPPSFQPLPLTLSILSQPLGTDTTYPCLALVNCSNAAAGAAASASATAEQEREAGKGKGKCWAGVSVRVEVW